MARLILFCLLALPVLAQTPAQYYRYFADRGYAMREVTLIDRGNGIEVIGPHSVTSALPDEVESEAWLQATMNPPMPAPNGITSEGRIVAQGVDVEMQSPDTGVILVDANTNKWLVTIADGEVVGVQISASPEISMDERRTRIQVERTRRQAIRDELGLTAQQIDLIRQWAAAETDALFSNLNANQRRFMKIQHQLVRMIAKRELKEITE